MPATAVIVIVLCSGLFIGSRFESARAAHGHFTSYRARTGTSLTAWITGAIKAGLGVAILSVVLYVILFQLHVR
jgi:hypothetical protein